MGRMGSTLAELSERAADSFLEIAKVKARDREENLRRAIDGYEKALHFFSSDTYRLRNARIRNNLGVTYSLLAEVREKEANLTRAIAAFQEALRVYSFDAFPQDYAMTQNNLGNAYRSLAEVRDKEANLNRAIASFREALRVFNIESLPEDYARASANLASTYAELASVRRRGEHMEEAKDLVRLARTCYDNALKVFKPDFYPAQHEAVSKSLAQLDSLLTSLER